MKMRLFTLTSALILAFAPIAMTAPVPTIELVPNGTSFSVMASNFTKISGFEMTIQYNPLALQNPQIVPGDMVVGGIFIPNVSASRSTVRIVLSNAFKSIEGAGKLATVSFAPIAGGAAKGNVNILGDGYKFTSDKPVRTVAVKLISSAEQNLGKLENDAIVACLNSSSTCTATVRQDGSVELQYKDNTPSNATCGSANGSRLSAKPTSNLCLVGTPSVVTGDGPWVWKCASESGGAAASCSAERTSEVTKGVCGPANGVTVSTMPAFNLCASGTPSEVTESGSWNWICSGVNGGASSYCSAPTPVSLNTQYATQTGQTSAVGMITLPPDQLATSDKKPDSQPLVTDLRKDMTIPVGGAEAATAASGQKPVEKDKEAESKFVSYKAALQFFATYTGERNPKNLIALFAEPAIPSFIQDPPIALADGKGLVKIRLLVNTSRTELPKFIMQGASLKRLPAQGEDGFWSMEVVPKKGVYEAKLTVIDGGKMLEFPLTVAPVTVPLLGKDKKFSEADFARFLSKPAKHDLNADKKFDYIDDFIYTANYIVAMKIKPEKLKKIEPKIEEDGKRKEPTKIKNGKAKDGMEKTAPKPVTPVKKSTEISDQK